MKEVENFLRTISDGLKSLASGIETLSKRVDELAKSEGGNGRKRKAEPKQKPQPTKGRTVAKAAAKPGRKKAEPKRASGKESMDETAFDSVMNIIQSEREGVDTSFLMEKTDFDAKKIANIIYKAKKRGLIRSVSKGVYTKA